MAEDKPLALSVGVLGLPLVLIPFLRGAGVNDDAIGPLSTATVGLLELAWLRRSEEKGSKESRAIEAEAGAVKTNPLPLIVALGVTAAGLATLVEFILSATAARAIDLGRTTGFLIVTGKNANIWRSNLESFLVPIGFVATLLLAILLAKYAAHRLGVQPFFKMLGSILVSALLIIAVNVPFALSVAEATSRDATEVIVASFPGWLKEAGLAALALVLAFWLGSEWARRTQDEFLMGRLLAKTAPEDRKAVLELLRPTPKTEVVGTPPPEGGAGERGRSAQDERGA
jgi:hypothetical protein